MTTTNKNATAIRSTLTGYAIVSQKSILGTPKYYSDIWPLAMVDDMSTVGSMDGMRVSVFNNGNPVNQPVKEVLKTHDLKQPHADYMMFCDVMKGNYGDVKVLNDSAFILATEPACDNKKKADKCGAKNHIVTLKLVHPEADPELAKFVHNQDIVAQCGNFVRLMNGVTVWLNWFCFRFSAMPLHMSPNMGSGDVIHEIKCNNKLHRTLDGTTDSGHLNFERYDYMGGFDAYKLDCTHCDDLDTMRAMPISN